MIAALIKKDLKLYFRNQFIAVITGLALVAYVAIYYLLPSTVDTTLEVALYVENAGTAESFDWLGEGLKAKPFDSQEALIDAVDDGDYTAGLVLAADTQTAIERGERTTATIYYAPGITTDQQESFTDLLTVALNNSYADVPFMANITQRSEVLGQDLSKPLAGRDRLLPALIMMIFVMEAMGLANLITEEVEQNTARAVLTTPLSMSQFFASKALMGIGLAFVQVLLLIIVTGSITTSPVVLLATLAAGSLLITGIAFLIASVAKDFMSVMAWSILAIFILATPVFSIIYPGLASDWIKAIPSYYLVDTLHHILNYGAGWSDVYGNLLVVLVIGTATLGLGSMALRRKFQ